MRTEIKKTAVPRRALTWLLVLLMVVTLLPTPMASAAETKVYQLVDSPIEGRKYVVANMDTASTSAKAIFRDGTATKVGTVTIKSADFEHERPYIDNPGSQYALTYHFVSSESGYDNIQLTNDGYYLDGGSGNNATVKFSTTITSFHYHSSNNQFSNNSGAKYFKINGEFIKTQNNAGDKFYFFEEVTYYTVTWKNYDGTELEKDDQVKLGTLPSYDGDTPTRPSDNNNTYVFAGWNPTISEVTEDVTYTATYTETPIEYTITWQNSNGEVIRTDTAAYGDNLTPPELPAKSSGVVKYTFNGWVDEEGNTVTTFPPVTGDATYTATYGTGSGTAVVNYAAKQLLAENVDTSKEWSATAVYSGEFSVIGSNLYFTPSKTGVKFDKTDPYDFASKESSSVTYTDTDGNNCTVTVIPGADLYYDDEISNATVKPAELAENNMSSVTTGAYNHSETKDLDKATYELTFTGTGIDVYCTTDTNVGYMQAELLKGNERVDFVTMKNHSDKTRYNVPTVSFTGKTYGTYTLKLNILSSSKYVLDGIRIYNENSAEKAAFANLHKELINKLESSFSAAEATTEGVKGVLFVDNFKSIDDQTPFAAYAANSPKNEIYLSRNQGITFTVTNVPKDARVQVGLSAPQAGSESGTVLINGEEYGVGTALDMYYEFVSAADGEDLNVTIANKDCALISVTNLKVIGNGVRPTFDSNAEATKATTLSVENEDASNDVMTLAAVPAEPMEIVVNAQTVKYAARMFAAAPPAEETPVPTEEPVVPTEEPVIPTEEPVVPTEEPVIPTEEPVVPTEEPVVPTEEPVIPTEEPATPFEEPAGEETQTGKTDNPNKGKGNNNGSKNDNSNKGRGNNNGKGSGAQKAKAVVETVSTVLKSVATVVNTLLKLFGK